MPVNTGLAQLSNYLVLLTVVIYSLAVLAYAADLAYGHRRGEARKGHAVVAKVPELVGAAGTAAAGAGEHPRSADREAALSADVPDGGLSGPGASSVPGPAARSPVSQGRPARVALWLTALGLLTHMLGILTRGLVTGRVPLGNMYEFVLAVTCVAITAFLVAAVRYRAAYVGLFVMVPVVTALGLDVTVLYVAAGALMPALQSYWIGIHVTAMTLAAGVFTLAAVVSVMYLLAERHARLEAAGQASGRGGIMRRLPAPEVLDRLSYRTVIFAFPIWTFGVIAGAIWADQAWGRYWGWDPKETWAFITWVVYACFLHARATAGWRGRKAAYIQLTGFACLIFNLVGVNIWITGLHSYAGLS